METEKIKKVHMIGIKGVGMTMLAQYLAGQGITITGSDTNEKFMTDAVLESIGADFKEDFDPENIPSDTDLIIYSSAYSADKNPELAAAIAGKAKVLAYAQALGEVFNRKYGIAVVGSHGKTTVTAWLGYVMHMSMLAPSVMVGASVPQFKGAALVGRSDYLVIEADEYQNKLQYFQPKAVLLNNIDWDHPDYFPTKEKYNEAFIEFIKKIPGKGFLVCNFDDPAIRKIARVNCRGKVISYAIDEAADYVAYDIKAHNGQTFFKVKFGVDASDDEDIELGDFAIQLCGRHNVQNALAVIAASIELGIDLVKIRTYLENFTGTARRMQVLGEFRGATIIDDYAHHPTEIKATLAGIRQKYPDRRIVTVFHPHTFTRTKALLADFAASFDNTDALIILDIYGSAREEHGGVSSQELADKVAQNSKKLIGLNLKHIPDLASAEAYLRDNIERGDVVVLMGAGDVFRIGENLLK